MEVNKEMLIEMYVNQQMSTRDIAKALGCGQTTVRRKMDQFGMQTRDGRTAQQTPSYLEKAKKNKPPIKQKTIPDVTIPCNYCGDPITKRQTEVKDKNYCCKECADKAKVGVPNELLRNRELVHCAQCGKEIYRIKSRLKKNRMQFCNKECHAKWKQKSGMFNGINNPRYNGGVELTCPICNTKFIRNKATVEANEICYCSRECMAQDYSRRFSGEKSPTWQGGDINYYGSNWLSQRRKARKRDNYVCQMCGTSEEEYGQELSVHHIKKFRDCADYKEANQLANLTSLCEPCHRVVHSNQYNGKLIAKR